MSRAASHLLAPDGRTWCNKEITTAMLVVHEPERATCSRCLATLALGRRGRADRGRVGLGVTAPWDRSMHEEYTRWSLTNGRYFKVWRVQPWPRAKDTAWHVEEIEPDGTPAGHASLDTRYPGERRVVWVGGFYARAATLDEARRIIAAETAPPTGGCCRLGSSLPSR